MKIRIFKSLVIFILSMVAINVFAADGDDPLHGQVTLTGRIVNAACSIDLETQDQTVDMGVLPVSEIARNGSGNKKYFTINFVQCVLPFDYQAENSSRNFSIAFNGLNKAKSFGLNGDARGVNIELQDTAGNIIEPGKAWDLAEVAEGTATKVQYALRLVSNHSVLRPGKYHTVIKFTINYY